LIQPSLVAQVKEKIVDKHDYFDIVAEYPKDSTQLDGFYGSKQEVGCSLGSI
jgi:branched-chain amino acid transport system substrate-binding protein